MSSPAGRIDKAEIEKYFPSRYSDLPVTVLEEVDSTNSYAKKMLANAAEHGTLIAAVRQTAGRGRQGRAFFSPDTGLYMSLILKDSCGRLAPELITPAAAVAVCAALEALYSLEPKIKWVNDIFCKNKKICGILTELVPAEECPCYIVGIGVNFCEPVGGFPPELKMLAGHLSLEGRSKGELAARIAQELLDLYSAGDAEHVKGEYDRRMFLTGRRVSFLKDGSELSGTVLGTDIRCRLAVGLDGGGEVVLTSGEVSLGSGEFAGECYEG